MIFGRKRRKIKKKKADNTLNIFSAYYFPPIRYVSDFIKSETNWIDEFENFQKQTYRNRCYILGPNGRQLLVVPIVHNGKRRMKDIEISYDANWQKEHFKSLEAAYRRSSFFEFYEHYFTEVFEKKHKYLLDLNLSILEQILRILQKEVQIYKTEKYIELSENDFREKYQAKKEAKKIPEYAQVFQEKLPFETDLSIIDLICNNGPESVIYLKNI